MIRGDLLDSERYWSVSIEAQLLFVHLLLTADDFGCLSLAPAFIRRRCFNGAPTDPKINALLSECADADLIRFYQSKGQPYGFIPRFRQRLQRMTLKNPQPVEHLYQDDEDASIKFHKINEIRKNPTVGQPPEEKRREVEEKMKRRESTETVPPPAWWKDDRATDAMAKQLGIEPRPGDGYSQLRDRLFAELNRRKPKV